MTIDEFNEWFRYDKQTGLIFYKKDKRKRRVTSLSNPAGTINNGGYWILKFKGKMYTHHRLIWFVHHGSWPVNEIDHINGISTDNRIENLRDVPKYLNLSNQYKHRGGKLVGCSFDKRRNLWKAKIILNKKEHWLGYYKTELDAHLAYMKIRNLNS